MGDTSEPSDIQEITLASDCSGMELAPKILEQLGYKVRSLWVSETSEHALKFIRCNADPDRIYRDMTERDSSELPKDVDIYLAGPPCTAWSSMNIKQKHASASGIPARWGKDAALPRKWLLPHNDIYLLWAS